MFYVTNSVIRNVVLYLVLVTLINSTKATSFTICDGGTRYEYDIDQCPGGIQIRDVDKWFSDARDQTCICGESSMLQFNGKIIRWHRPVYPLGTDYDMTPRLGSFEDYRLRPICELLKGNNSGALFINLKKYENPENMISRAVEVLVENYQEDRLPGHFRLAFLYGTNNRHKISLYQYLRTIILNNQEPTLISEDPEAEFISYVCSYNATNPEVIVARYVTATWGNQDLVKNCENNVYKPYIRPSYICPTNCDQAKKFEPPPPSPDKDQPSMAFLQFMLTMSEIAVRMKYAEKYVTFQHKDHPYAAILQYSSRVFYRAFPTVVSWETLMNAVTLFGVAFEGLVPSAMQKDRWELMKIMLGRCTIQEMRREKEHTKMLNELCPAISGAVETELNSSIANVNLNPSSAAKPGKDGQKAGGGGAGGGGSKMKTSFGGPHNIVVELLWKVVQFVHGSCLSSAEHNPNVHHEYTQAMMEMFSAPAVQLLWYQQGKYDYRQLGKAMIHIFPELADHVLPTIDLLLQKLKFETYFTILQRPTIANLDERDMRCAGHGKLIWGGKACCYSRSEDKKYYYFNKVAFAKL